MDGTGLERAVLRSRASNQPSGALVSPWLGMDKSYDRLFRHVFTPILDRYGVLPQDRLYIMAFHAVILAPPPESGIILLQAHVLPDLKFCKGVLLMISYRKLAMRVLGHSPVSAAKTARRSTAKRAAALTLTAALVVGMTLPAFADVYDLTKGDISVGFKNNQQTVTQEDGNGGYVKNKNNEDIKDLPDNDVVITTKDDETGKVETTDNTVTINSNEGETVNVTLDNVNINTSKTGEAAVSVTGKGDTNIELNGNNTLTSGSGHAGLEHNKETNSEGNETSGTLTITDNNNNGKLTANGGAGSAGIGGGFGNDGQAAITGGEIIANGGDYGAGIGGGKNYNSAGGNGDVAISGGKITAQGGDHAAGVGGGGDYNSNSTNTGNGNVTISGGEITASGGWLGSGIGGGIFGTGTVTIEGNAVIKDAQGGAGAAGIGGGSYGDGDVKISGNAVIANAESAGYGSGIGAGQGSLKNNISTVGDVTIEGNAKIENAKGGYLASGIGGGSWGGTGTVVIRDNAKIDSSIGGTAGAGIGSGIYGDVTVSIEGNSTIGTTTGGTDGAGIGGGYGSLGDVTIEGNVTIKNAQGGAGAAGIGGGLDAETKNDGTGNRIVIRSNEDGSPTINATGGVPEVDDDGNAISAGGAAIGSGASLPDENGDVASEADADITIEGKVTIDAKAGEGNAAIGANNTEQTFNGLQVGTTITRHNAKGDDVSQPGDVVREQVPTETETAEAPSTGSVEVERPVTVEGLYVTNVLGKQITHTCTQNGTTLTIRANGIVASAHLTLGMVRTLKAQGVKTLVFTTLLSRSTTVSVDSLLAADPDAPDETAVVWTHTGIRTALTIGGADHSALLK